MSVDASRSVRNHACYWSKIDGTEPRFTHNMLLPWPPKPSFFQVITHMLKANCLFG